jgi:hypothetical protein
MAATAVLEYLLVCRPAAALSQLLVLLVALNLVHHIGHDRTSSVETQDAGKD